MILILALLATVQIGAPAQPTGDERAILEAVLHAPELIRHFGGSAVRVDRLTSRWLPSYILDRRELTVTRFDSRVTFRVAESLIVDAKARTREQLDLSGLTLPAGTGSPRDPQTSWWNEVMLPRPGIAPDGLSAIALIYRGGEGGTNGFILFLEKSDGNWKVVGGGPSWIS